MKLNGLHILLTYQCTLQCDHCFVWGSPWQSGVLNLEQVADILGQAHQMEGIEWIYFEGGEPFLYYPILLRGVQMASAAGFRVGVVSNAYWATTPEDALAWLTPFAEILADLTVSSDQYHYSEANDLHARNAVLAAQELAIPIGEISVAPPAGRPAGRSEADQATQPLGKTLAGQQSAVMYRGRAVRELAGRSTLLPWEQFTACRNEDLRKPGRIHVDPFGNLHICQGISIGNLFKRPLQEICAEYDPDAHPICGPLLVGGPVGLVGEYALPHGPRYADACHLCYEARLALRGRFPDVLTPNQVYGV
jgi:MoaA/NifB/PqqE/SkfB family radical SAM enzyme